MLPPALDRDRIDVAPRAYLAAIGAVFAVFDEQGSGNLSYGVRVGEQRCFVKTAGRSEDGGPAPHEARVELLRNGVAIAAACVHPALPAVRRVIESPEGPLVVHDWFDGELVHARRDQRSDPASPWQRFLQLPVAEVVGCLDAIVEVHAQLARAGWVAVDFYDGCLMYDFAARALRIIDLDMYRRGAFRNDLGRWWGSTRFMAPEEHELGATIDERTTVFTLGRTAQVLLGEGPAFRGSPGQLAVATRACRPARKDRYPSVAALAAAWRSAEAAG